MDLDYLPLCYSMGIFLMVVLGVILTTAERRGKFSRALFISAVAGTLVPLVTCYTYSYFFPPPITPTPLAIDPNGPILPQFFSSLIRCAHSIGEATGYDIGRKINAFAYGITAIAMTFALSFLIPFRSKSSG